MAALTRSLLLAKSSSKPPSSLRSECTCFTTRFHAPSGTSKRRSRSEASSSGSELRSTSITTKLRTSEALNHAYLVYDAQGKWRMVSNAVPVTLVK